MGRAFPSNVLRRELGLLGTVSVSIGVMAPTLAMSITGVEPARLLGTAAPLAYVVAALGVGLVAYGFIRLSGAIAHAGSVYAFAGHSLGPRAGLFTGWALLGTYLIFPAVSMLAFATFGQALLRHAGIADDASWLPIAFVGWGLMGLIASREVRAAARALLSLEVVSVLLILGLMALVVVRLLAGDAPDAGSHAVGDLFDLPDGATLSTVALAATFGFLSFAGFESAGSFGEEADRPTRDIPRSIVIAVAFGGVFYVLCESVQTLGFGTGAAGIGAFRDSGAPLGDLAQAYAGQGLAAILDAAAMISAVGAGLGCACVGARMLFALGRDEVMAPRLSQVSGATGAPVAGLAVVLAIDAALLVGFYAAGVSALGSFFQIATIGVLNLLVMYIVANVGALRFLWRRGERAELLLPLAGIGVACYVLYHNLRPVPPAPFDRLPYVAGAWLAAGALLIWLVPGLAARAAANLRGDAAAVEEQPVAGASL